MRLAFVTGLRQEARVLKPLACPVYVGGGTPQGAMKAARRAVADGMEALVSFGLAGALSEDLRAGDIIRPEVVLWNGREYETDDRLTATLGEGAAALLCWTEAAETAAHKAALRQSSGAVAIDLESGPAAELAARHGLRFAVLRAICDTASTDLPTAARDALDAKGRIRLWQVVGRVMRQPQQLPALAALARDAAHARTALASEVARLARTPALLSGA